MDSEKDWFGHHLQELRVRAGLTQAEFSERLDVGLQAVKDWEKGRKRPHLDRLPALADALGVELRALLPASEKPQEGLGPEPGPGRRVEARLARIERQIRQLRAELQAGSAATQTARPTRTTAGSPDDRGSASQASHTKD